MPQAGATPQQVAALSYRPLPGIRRAARCSPRSNDTDPEHDDNSPRITQASLPGLARLAARGLLARTAAGGQQLLSPGSESHPEIG